LSSQLYHVGYMVLSLRAFAPERPLYRRLVEELRAEVAKRAVGDKIDSEPKLAQRFGVS
jgi:DNA-binding GntR family transcriptional regulator